MSAAIAPAPAEEPHETAVLTPVEDRATRVRTRADALEPVQRLRITRTAVSQVATPPDIWSDDRPALRKIWNYTQHGEWTGTETAARPLATIYTVLIAFPITAVGYIALWIVERPARLFVAALLGALIKLAI
ncbi:MAG TPA: hypothetical protein VIP06_02950 [Nocardioides sp.]